ncbi:MAG: ABC transporter ATP-binding protein [Proteobacteria bacterium]|nr:ABC transporter ATP-binding protein [Pseudomonadota bacterium]
MVFSARRKGANPLEPILEVRDLVKRYNRIQAVDGVSFSIPPGICFGLLGPNGAGKTTTIEIMEGITPATSGSVFYRGGRPGRRFKEETGIQFQSTSLLSKLTVAETLRTFSGMYARRADLDALVANCFLGDLLDRDNERLSGGQRQRLLLAMALVNDPDLVFLDEPTTGLDPQARRHVWRIVEGMRRQGKTVLLTTHYMEEAQSLCDEIAIMDNGRIIAQGSPADLLAEHLAGAAILLPAEAVPGDPAALFAGREAPECDWRRSQKGWTVTTRQVNACIRALLDAGADLNAMTIRSPNLEDLFLRLTGRDLRD